MYYKPQADDCIDFYDIDPALFAAFPSWAAGQIDQALYLTLGLPFPIGKFHAEAMKNFPISPLEGIGPHFSAQYQFAHYVEGDKVKLAEAIDPIAIKLTEWNAGSAYSQEHADLLKNVHATILNFDRQVFGGDSVQVQVNIDLRHLTPDFVKAPFWHIDDGVGQTTPTSRDLLLPLVLFPVLRGYTFRMAPPDCEENIQVEYIADRHLLTNGRPHPLVLKAFQHAKKMIGLRESWGVTNYDVSSYLSQNVDCLAQWVAAQREQEMMDHVLREEGLILQAEPGEVLLATNYVIHRTKRPSKALRSGFYLLGALNADKHVR